MKDGKYEVGDVIAFRVTKKGRIAGKPWIGMEHIFLEADGTSDDGFALERIPNPKLMEGEWWKGWTWKKVSVPRYKLQPGEVQLYYSGTLIETGRLECERPTLGASGTCGNPQIVLVPPGPKPLCPELREKIERVEAELAELKKQALGE